MEKVLVTGGAGFIGSHLVRALLESGEKVVVLDTLLRGNKIDRDVLADIELIVGDVRDRELVMKTGRHCHKIFHLAALLGVDLVADNPLETMEIESVGTKNIIDSAVKNGVGILVYSSTSGVYGHSALQRSVTEDIILDPRTSYAIAKRYNEILLLAVAREKGIDTVSLRFFNVYGPKQDNRMVIPRFFEQAIAGDKITVYGSGEQTRDFTWIDDVVKSTMLVSNLKGIGEIFNVAKEEEMTIAKLADEIKQITHSKSEIALLPAPMKRYDFEVERRVGNSDKLRRFINYAPQTTLQTGLKQIWETVYKK